MEIKETCKDCLLYNSNNKFCARFEHYENEPEHTMCDYGVTQQDYDRMCWELENIDDMQYWAEMY